MYVRKNKKNHETSILFIFIKQQCPNFHFMNIEFT